MDKASLGKTVYTCSTCYTSCLMSLGLSQKFSVCTQISSTTTDISVFMYHNSLDRPYSTCCGEISLYLSEDSCLYSSLIESAGSQ